MRRKNMQKGLANNGFNLLLLELLQCYVQSVSFTF